MKNAPRQLRLAGIGGGIRYLFGVRNPLDGRQGPTLGPRHLKALELLLEFIDLHDPESEYEVPDDEFNRRYQAPDGSAV